MIEDDNTAQYPNGLIKKKSKLSIVWIIPIIALVITVGMIWKSYISAGTKIYVVTEDGSGIINGKTPLMYKGVKIGRVEDVNIKKDDLSKLELTIVIQKSSAEAVARKDNKFWKVEPKVSLTQISGLSTIVSGVYLEIMPSVNSRDNLVQLPFEDHFTALENAPVDIFSPGLLVIVNTIKHGDIAVGAPILYNKQAIGIVEDKKLTKDNKSIDLYLRINTKYMDLVHKKSTFHKLSAIDIKANFSGVKVHMGSFASFIAGGIVLKNTDEAALSPQALNDDIYELYANEEALSLSKDEILLSIKKSPNIEAGLTKIFCMGVEAGEVNSVKYDINSDITNIKLKLFKDFKKLANEKAYFWIVTPSLGFDKVEGLDTVVRGNYINFISSDYKAKEKTSFVLHVEKPKLEGKNIQLLSDNIGSLKEGAGIFYHHIKIGVINSFKINDDKKTFTIFLTIEPKYTKLLNTSSLFYNESGIEVNANLSKLEIKTGSLETILRGGIAVITPNFKSNKNIKKEYKLYKSYESVQKAQNLATNGIYITLSSNKLGSLKVGSPILFKQIKVGEVLSYKLEQDKVLFSAFIMEKYIKKVKENSLFYNASGVRVKLGLGGVKVETESIETILAGGISFFTPSTAESKLAVSHQSFNLYDSKDKAEEKFVNFKLLSSTSNGLDVGSLIKYKNVVIGHVSKIKLDDKLVSVGIQLESKYSDLVKKDTIFWVEKFSVGMNGVKNTSSIIKGSWINLRPGKSLEKPEAFFLMAKPPMPHFKEDGLRIIVQASRLGGIKENAPLYYRQVQIGSVTQYDLKEDATGIEIEVFVEPCFAHLIKSDSYFYNASGIGMDLSLFGAKIKTETIESILTGGISVLTPDSNSVEALDSQVFILNDSFDSSYLNWAPKLHSSNPMCQ